MKTTNDTRSGKKLAKSKLSRRTMLKGMMGGTTVAVGLPLLEAMLNSNGTALASGGELPTRFMTWYWADGVIPTRFEPQGVGNTWSLREMMQPLAGVKDYLNVCTGLRNHSWHGMTHHAGMAVFSGHTVQPASGFVSDVTGPTIDQLIADRLQARTPIRSVQVLVSKRQSTDGDGGTTYLALSHRGEPGNLVALPPEHNPQTVWQTLFGEFAANKDDRQLRESILDYVRGDAAALQQRLGATDKQRLDAHLEGVFELEQKIAAAVPICEVPALPTETNTDEGGVEPMAAVNDAMVELIRYAFTCDITRVASFMFKRFVSSTHFSDIGANYEHHAASHINSPDYAPGVTYMMERFADLLERFRATEEPDGTNLLDSTIIYASTDCSTPWNHSIRRQPIILAGHGRGYLQYPGIHHQAAPLEGNTDLQTAGNLSDVLLTCLQAFDPDASEIGGGGTRSDTPLTDVLA